MGPQEIRGTGSDNKRRRRTSPSKGSPSTGEAWAGEEKEEEDGECLDVVELERPVGLLDCTRLTLEACCRVIVHLRAQEELDQTRADSARSYLLFTYAMLQETFAGHELIRVLAGRGATSPCTARPPPAPPSAHLLPSLAFAQQGARDDGPPYGSLSWARQLYSDADAYVLELKLSPTDAKISCNDAMASMIVNEQELLGIARQCRIMPLHALGWCLDPFSLYDFFLAQGRICFGKPNDAVASCLEKHGLVKVHTRHGKGGVLRCLCTQRLGLSPTLTTLCIRFWPLRSLYPTEAEEDFWVEG